MIIYVLEWLSFNLWIMGVVDLKFWNFSAKLAQKTRVVGQKSELLQLQTRILPTFCEFFIFACLSQNTKSKTRISNIRLTFKANSQFSSLGQKANLWNTNFPAFSLCFLFFQNFLYRSKSKPWNTNLTHVWNSTTCVWTLKMPVKHSFNQSLRPNQWWTPNNLIQN